MQEEGQCEKLMYVIDRGTLFVDLRCGCKHDRKLRTVPEGPTGQVKLEHVAEINAHCVNQPKVARRPDDEGLWSWGESDWGWCDVKVKVKVKVLPTLRPVSDAPRTSAAIPTSPSPER